MHGEAHFADISRVDTPVTGHASPTGQSIADRSLPVEAGIFSTRGNEMRTIGSRQASLAALLPLLFGLPGLAIADTTHKCSDALLKGEYVFTATGFTRAPNSLPGAPWVPKAILEVLHFNGDGTLSTPAVTIANPFGDTGAVLQPPAGAPGVYTVNADCTGSVQFLDATGAMFRIHVDAARGDTIRMIQTNPVNNVFQGIAKRAG